MDKKEIIERLYALRAAISLLAMQFDKYDKANRDKVQQIYLDTATKFKNLMEENMYQSKGEYDHFFEFPAMHCQRYNRELLGNRLVYWGTSRHGSDTDESDAISGRYWLRVIEQVCVYDEQAYRVSHSSAKSHYEKLIELSKQYGIEIYPRYCGKSIFDKKDYDKWKSLYDNKPYETRVVRDYIVDMVENEMNEINYDCISLSKENEWSCAEFLINSIIGGRWLFTDEARTHYQNKLNELNDLVDTIRSDTDRLRPKGLAKVFNKGVNKIMIQLNEKCIDKGNIAIANVQKGLEFLDKEIPNAKVLLEKVKPREMEEIKAEYVLMLRAIQEEFADVLDKRDWQDVDLLIYYFESGRADNLKEALLQVDNERRTNRIVDTIKEATNRICWTLKTGFDMLNRTLQQGFAAIESRIQQQNILLAQQNQLLAKQNGLIAQQNAQLSDLVSAANLSNALLTKQNESSEQLVSKMTTLERVIVA